MKKTWRWIIFLACVVLSILSLVLFFVGFPLLLFFLIFPPIIFFGDSNKSTKKQVSSYCMICGSRIQERDNFCSNCGEKIEREER
ncbi:MAG: zinc ribbon domain-containing protein [Candidatus Helarchaeota archaeon]